MVVTPKTLRRATARDIIKQKTEYDMEFDAGAICSCYPNHCENPAHGICWCSPSIEERSHGRLEIHRREM